MDLFSRQPARLQLHLAGMCAEKAAHVQSGGRTESIAHQVEPSVRSQYPMATSDLQCGF